MKEHAQNEPHPQIQITLPAGNVLREQLQKAGLYKQNPGTDVFYDFFVDQIAGSQKVASGVVIAYEFAIYQITDTCKNQDFPLILNYFHAMFDRVANSISDDKNAQEQMKFYMQNLKNHLIQ